LHELPKVKKRDLEEQSKRDRVLALIREVGGGRADARELEEFVTQVCGVVRFGDRLESDWRQWSRGFDDLFHDLEEHNADFEVLQFLDKHTELFSSQEREELRPLLGFNGFENEKRIPSANLTLEQVGQRQQYWHQLAFAQRSTIRAHVAERASLDTA
jgi:hypothetical protein